APVLHAASNVEFELERAEAGNRRSSVCGKNVFAIFDARDLGQYFHGRLRQRQRYLDAGLVSLFGDSPLVARDLGPRHCARLGAATGCKQQKTDELPPWRRKDFGGPPYRAQFVISQNPVAFPLLRFAARHAANERRPELIVSNGVPIADAPQRGENLGGHCRATLVLDVIEQSVDVAALDIVNLPVAEDWINQPFEICLPLGGSPQLATFADKVTLADSPQRVLAGFARPTTLDNRIVATGDLSENGARFPAGIFEAEHAVGGIAPGYPPAAILDHVALGTALGDRESERRQGGIPVHRALFSGLGAGLSHKGRRQLLYRHG